MQITVSPGKLSGTICAAASKSVAHRMLICASLSNKMVEIHCPETCDDIDATVSCLNALGAKIIHNNTTFIVQPIVSAPKEAILDCRESGSTLRFLLPLAGVLGVNATFLLRGRLNKRPLSPLWEEMQRMGCKLSRQRENVICCTGKLIPGAYFIDGSVSSQFVTGLFIALSALPGESVLNITGVLHSKPYVDITKAVLSIFGNNSDGTYIKGKLPFTGPDHTSVEGDWSSAAFFLAANALGSEVRFSNLNPNSLQGDRIIADLIPLLETHQIVDVAQTPDLMPILSVLAAAKNGAIFTNIQRLRLKESDRVKSVQEMLHNMGIHTESTEDTLSVSPGKFHSCTVNSYNDHRIAMAAAIAATIATGPIEITNAQCVNKSYPAFWRDFATLGGNYEQLEG